MVELFPLQLDLGMSGAGMTPSHGRVKLPPQAFRRRYLERPNSSESAGGGGGLPGDLPGAPQDDFTDLSAVLSGPLPRADGVIIKTSEWDEDSATIGQKLYVIPR